MSPHPSSGGNFSAGARANTARGDVGELLDLKALALLQRHLTQAATIAAYQDCFMVVTAICVAVMPLVLFLRRPPAE